MIRHFDHGEPLNYLITGLHAQIVEDWGDGVTEF